MVKAGQDLEAAQQHLRNVTEYDLIAREILSLRTRDDLTRNITEVEANITDVMTQIDAVEGRIQDRLEDCKSFLDSLYSAIDAVTADISDFKK